MSPYPRAGRRRTCHLSGGRRSAIVSDGPYYGEERGTGRNGLGVMAPCVDTLSPLLPSVLATDRCHQVNIGAGRPPPPPPGRGRPGPRCDCPARRPVSQDAERVNVYQFGLWLCRCAMCIFADILYFWGCELLCETEFYAIYPTCRALYLC